MATNARHTLPAKRTHSATPGITLQGQAQVGEGGLDDRSADRGTASLGVLDRSIRLRVGGAASFLLDRHGGERLRYDGIVIGRVIDDDGDISRGLDLDNRTDIVVGASGRRGGASLSTEGLRVEGGRAEGSQRVVGRQFATLGIDRNNLGGSGPLLANDD